MNAENTNTNPVDTLIPINKFKVVKNRDFRFMLLLIGKKFVKISPLVKRLIDDTINITINIYFSSLINKFKFLIFSG